MLSFEKKFHFFLQLYFFKCIYIYQKYFYKLTYKQKLDYEYLVLFVWKNHIVLLFYIYNGGIKGF